MTAGNYLADAQRYYRNGVDALDQGQLGIAAVHLAASSAASSLALATAASMGPLAALSWHPVGDGSDAKGGVR